jgi:hypothetical protein
MYQLSTIVPESLQVQVVLCYIGNQMDDDAWAIFLITIVQ